MSKIKPSDALKAAATPAVDDYDESFTPAVAVNADPTYHPPRLHPSPMFKLYASPERWCVMGGKVIPALGKFPLVAGINGIEMGPKGTIRSEDAELNYARKKGITFIPFDVDGKGTSYMKKPRGTEGVYLSKWEKVYPGSAQIDCDEKPYIEWCQSLITRGLIKPVPLYVLERMHAELVKQVEAYAGKQEHSALFNRLSNDCKAVEMEILVAKSRENVVTDEVTPDSVSP